METIIIFGAHSDDEIIGAGATIAKYVKEGKRVITVIFSSGEKSSPWLKKEFLVENRKKEARDIGEFLGAAETVFFNLPDAKLKEYTENIKVINNIKKVIKVYQPSIIFTHSKFDPHEDHKAVNQMVLKALNDIDPEMRITVYVFEVWNVVNETHPIIYIDVSETFWKKIDAMKRFKSQQHFIYPLLIPVFFKALFSGFHAKCKYAERFYKIR